MERIANHAYEASREQKIQVPNFPDFGPLVAEMKRTSGSTEARMTNDKGLKVTVQEPGGALVVKEPFFEQFGEMDAFQEVIQDHNVGKGFNKENLRMSEAPQRQDQQPQGQANKAAVVETEKPLTAESVATMSHSAQIFEIIVFTILTHVVSPSHIFVA